MYTYTIHVIDSLMQKLHTYAFHITLYPLLFLKWNVVILTLSEVQNDVYSMIICKSFMLCSQ